MTVLRVLGLGPRRWDDVDERTLPTSVAIVVVASSLLALNRLGGLVTQSPRAFARLGITPIWGWVGLTLVTMALSAVLATERPTLRVVATVTGRAHMPLIVVSFVLFGAAGLFQALWPGRVAVALTSVVLMPAVLVGGLVHAARLTWRAAAIAGLGAYAIWLVTVGRELHEQLGHLY